MFQKLFENVLKPVERVEEGLENLKRIAKAEMENSC